MRRAAPFLHGLTTVVLLASTAVGGWLAACPRPGAMVHAHLAAAHQHMAAAHAHMAAAHRMVYGAVHHHAPRRPPPPPLPDDWKECLSMGMAGASCFGAANAAALELASVAALGSGGYPPAAGVHDRLPNDLPSEPPRG